MSTTQPSSGLAGRSVLVTGAGGFIGGHLVARHVREGAAVRAFVRYNSRNDRGDAGLARPRGQRAKSRSCSATCATSSRSPRRPGRRDRASTSARRSRSPTPTSTRATSSRRTSLGTLNVAQAALRARRRSASSTPRPARSTGRAQTRPDHRGAPARAAVALRREQDRRRTSWWRASTAPSGCRSTIVRPFNTYGPRQSARAVIPTIIAQALAGGTLGSARSTRGATSPTSRTPSRASSPRRRAGRAVGRTIQLGTGARRLDRRDRRASSASCSGESSRSRPTRRACARRKSEVERLISDPALAGELLGWEPRGRPARRAGAHGRVDRAQHRALPHRRSTSYEGGRSSRRPRHAAAPVHDGPAQAARAGRRPADPRAHPAPAAAAGVDRGRPLRRPPRRADPGLLLPGRTLPDGSSCAAHWEDEPLGHRRARCGSCRTSTSTFIVDERRRADDARLRRAARATTAPQGAALTIATHAKRRRRSTWASSKPTTATSPATARSRRSTTT